MGLLDQNPMGDLGMMGMALMMPGNFGQNLFGIQQQEAERRRRDELLKAQAAQSQAQAALQKQKAEQNKRLMQAQTTYQNLGGLMGQPTAPGQTVPGVTDGNVQTQGVTPNQFATPQPIGAPVDPMQVEMQQIQAGLQNPDPYVRQMAQQAYWTLVERQNKQMTTLQKNAVAAGYKRGTPEYEAFMRQSIMKPTTSVNFSQFGKPPSGYYYADPSDPTKGVKRLPGVGRSEAESESLTSAATALKDIQLMESVLFPKGDFNRSAAIAAAASVPGTDGRTAGQAIRRTVEVLLRMRTGAAAPAHEVDNYTAMYSPGPLDTAEQAKIKLDRLKEFYASVLSYVKTGRKGDMPDIPGVDSGKENNLPAGEIEATDERNGKKLFKINGKWYTE